MRKRWRQKSSGLLRDELRMHKAARSRDASALRAFIDTGVNVNSRDARGFTVLHEACFQGDETCVRVNLFQNGGPRFLRGFNASSSCRRSSSQKLMFICTMILEACLCTLLQGRGSWIASRQAFRWCLSESQLFFFCRGRLVRLFWKPILW